MPAKKTRKAGKAVYLLSADRKYRRLSLKKISERVKEARRPKRGRSIAKATTAELPSSDHRNVAPAKVAAAALTVAGLFLVTTLVAASWTSSPREDIPSAVALETPEVLTADVASAPVVRAAPPMPPTPKAPEMSRPAETVKPRVEMAPAPPPLAPVPARSLAPVENQPVAAAASVDTVTVSGCLDFDGKSAWLKNTSGLDAPKTRSWRSGFLKKSAPRIALVDGPASVETYDGRQVSVTGVLVDREMHVSSLRPIADNCE